MSRRLVALLATAVLVVGGLGAWAAHAHHEKEQPPSDPIAALAWKAAHEEQATVHGTFLVATYRPEAGLHGGTNTGHPCDRGHTLLVRLLWKDDANFVHGGVPGEVDGPHKALVLTVNVPSGQICLVGASYSHDDPRPGEIYLYGPRKDLVPSS